MWTPYASKRYWGRKLGGYITRPIKNQTPQSEKIKEMEGLYDVIAKVLFSSLFSSFRIKKRPQVAQKSETLRKNFQDSKKLERHRQAQARVRFRETE